MHILGVSGLSGSGKTTLIHRTAEAIVASGYGIPRICDYPPDGTEAMDRWIAKAQADEAERYEADPNWLGEIILLVDEVNTMEQIASLRKAGATLLFVDAGRRLEDGEDIWRQIDDKQRVALNYSQGLYPDELFDWIFTNNHNLGTMKSHVNRLYSAWIGGSIVYER